MFVVKYGGNAMGADSDAFLTECADLWRHGRQCVLIHGGGPQIDAALRQAGIVDRRIDGLRVTDAATLEVTERVLVASVNKRLVRDFARIGVAAVGISGQDGGLLVARPLAEYGFVGEVERVEPRVLHALLDAGFLPVVAPLGISRDGETAYNLNADTAAGAIAGALHADPYIVVTDVPRVRRDPRDPESGIERMSLAEAHDLLAAGVFEGGMLPKMRAVFAALAAGARSAVIVGGATPLTSALRGDGTTIEP